MRRHPHLALRRGNERARVALHLAFAPEVSQKRAHGGQLARRGGARLPPAVRVGKKRPDRLATEVRRTEIGARNARRGGSVDEKLREVAFVRAHGVRRRVAIKSEKL